MSRRMPLAVLLAAGLWAHCAATASGQVTLSQDFDSGALVVATSTVDMSDPNAPLITLDPRNNYDEPGVWGWVHCRLDGVAGRKPVFRVDRADAAWGGPSALHRWLYSYDQVNWQRFDNTAITAPNYYQFSNNAAFTGDTVHIASSTPYPVSRTDALVAALVSNPNVYPTASADANLIVGHTPGTAGGDYYGNPYYDDLGRTIPPENLYGFVVTDPAVTRLKTRIVVIGGNHSCETHGNYAVEGFINFVAGSDPRAAELRKVAEFYFYPQVDPEGRATGYWRSSPVNPLGNHNRVWGDYSSIGDPKFNPEIVTVEQAMRADTCHKVHYFLDFHTMGTIDNSYPLFNSATFNSPFALNLAARDPEHGSDRQLHDFHIGYAQGWAAADPNDPAAYGLGAAYSGTPEMMGEASAGVSRLLEIGTNYGLAFYDTLVTGEPPLEDESPPPIILSPDVTLTARTFPLCPYQRKLDGQWQCSRVASDGKVYFGSSTHAHDTGGMFLQYDPAADQVHVLAQDISYVCGENPTVLRPQGKLHSDLVEHDGWLYFATYYGYTGRSYTGGHVLRYRLGSFETGTPEFQDLGIPQAGAAIYSAITVDPVYGRIYVNAGGTLYRYNLDGSGKMTLGYIGGTCFYHFTDSQGNLWTSSSGNVGRLYKIDPTGAIQYWDDALPLVRRPDNDQVHWDQSGRWFHWADRRDGERFVFAMRQDGNLYEFDMAVARTGNIAGAFRKIAHIGVGGLDMCLAGSTVYWLQSARAWESGVYTHDAKAADHHLKSINVDDPNQQITDWGRLIDPDGRTPYRCEGMSADASGRIYLTGDWRVWPEEIGTDLSTSRHDVTDPDNYFDLWRGQFFAVAEVAADPNFNHTPTVYAGSDRTIYLPTTSLALAGTVSDDGNPAAGTLTQTWTKTSGTGTVAFANANAVDTTATFSTLGTYVLRLTANDGELTAFDELTVVLAPESSGLRLHLPLDELSGTTAQDVSGNNRHGALQGGCAWTTGHLAGALHFDEVNGVAIVPGGDYGGEYSVSFWFRPDDNVGGYYQYMFSHGTVLTQQSVNVFLAEQDEPLVGNVLRTLLLDADDVGEGTLDVANVVPDGEWHLYTLTVKAAEGARVYLDGQPAAADAARGGDAMNPSGSLYIGGRNDLNPNRFFGGGLDDVRIWDHALTAGDVQALYAGEVNAPPTADAGADQQIAWPVDTVSLDGTVSDDGLPAGGSVTILWTQSSGPGGVTFADAGAADTTATFSTAGTYLLQLYAFDGALSASDLMTVTVDPVNAAPSVDAGANQTIAWPQTVASLDGTVSDDGLPSYGSLTVTWSKQSGPGTVTFANASAVDTDVTFSARGEYVLRLTASDGAISASDEVTVIAGLKADFDGDGLITPDDVDLLYAVLDTTVPPTDPMYDLTEDGQVSFADAEELVEVIVGTSMADTNLDMKVDIQDLGNLANRYNASGTFSDCDTNGDGVVNLPDLGNLANDYGKTYP